MKRITMNFDGACTDTRKDGDMSIGVHAQYEGEEKGSLFEISKQIGIGTNNESEYSALIFGLVELINRGLTEDIVVLGDSKLVIYQMTGEYQVGNFQMFRYNNKAKELATRFKNIEFKHIPREENEYADELSKRCLKKTLVDYYNYRF